MKNKISEKTSSIIDELKGLALISIVSAHTATGGNGTIISNLSERFLKAFGIIGVLIFLIISGYLFGHDKKPLTIFSKRKIRSLIIPWVIVGTIVYMVSSFSGAQKEDVSIMKYLLFLIGQGTYLYFMTILIICYIVFFYLRKQNKILLISMLLSLISIVLTNYKFIGLNPYLNPLNWIGYFALGILISNNYRDINSYIPKLIYNNRIRVLALLLAFNIVMLVLSVANKSYSYWSLFGLLYAYSTMVLIFIFLEKESPIFTLIKLGKSSFTLYLLHMPIAGVINIIFSRFNNLIIFKPLIVIGVTLFLVEIFKLFSNKIGMQKYANIVLGIR